MTGCDLGEIMHDIMRYIYNSFELDYDKMKEIYQDVPAKHSYDDLIDHENWLDAPSFYPSSSKDNIYVYKNETRV